MFDDNDDEKPIALTINKSYANRYQTWREKEEKQKLIARYGSDVEDDSDDESEDDNAQEWTDDVEKEFLRCYSILKKRDPSIYNSSTTFFQETPEETAAEPTKKSKEKKKKMNLKDAEIQFAMAEAMENDDEEESMQKTEKKSIVEEREEIKRSFKKALEDDEDENDGQLLKKKVKTEAEKAEEEETYIQWLKGQKTEIADSSIKSDLSYLHDYWNDPSLSERDRFLRDFILNKMHKKTTDDDDDEEDPKIPSYDEIVDEEEDDDEFNKAEEFERKFNFRYQEPDAEFLKRYPRTIDDSFRRKDERRKLKREEKKKRKELEKQQRSEEIKRLKNLKKKEIYDKMQKLKTIAGDDDLPLNIDDLDEDFDPKEYDRRMKELFNDDYYQKTKEEETKPEVSDDELQVENWDQNKSEPVAPTEPKKKSKLSEAIKQSKPKFDPKEKSFEEYFDEYYKLDCEDFVGDTPVRFQYRQVEPNDFGLTVDEILNADDRELNAWCSLKKASQYRSKEEETHDRHLFRNKAKNVEKKKKILSSVYGADKEEEEEEEKPSQPDDVESTATSKTKKKNKNKSRNGKDAHLSSEQRLLTNMSDERLQIYGLNPKRFKNFVRFNKDKLSKE